MLEPVQIQNTIQLYTASCSQEIPSHNYFEVYSYCTGLIVEALVSSGLWIGKNTMIYTYASDKQTMQGPG